MSLLSNDEIKECMASRAPDGTVRWTNSQEHIMCFECENVTEPKNFSMMYRCDTIDTYTLYCVCLGCLKTHVTKLNVKRNHDKMQAIKKESKKRMNDGM